MPAPAASRTTNFGVDVSELFFSLRGTLDATTADRELAAAAADGVGVVRVAPLWEFTEPLPPRDGHDHYDWRFDDFIAGRLAAHGFRWIAVLAFAPSWASETPSELHGAPRDPADFAAYAGALAHRYRGAIVAFEVWNEENSPEFWRSTPDAGRYAQLYLAARAAIHHADPGVPVLVGGLANGARSFLSALLSNPELRNNVDGIAIHPYAPDPAQVLARVRDYRKQLRALGAGRVPLYVTEVGWSTQPTSSKTWAPDAQRGPYIQEVATGLLRSDCNVRSVILYAWTTPERDPTTADDWYGVARKDAAPSPTTEAVARTARALLEPGEQARLCGSP